MGIGVCWALLMARALWRSMHDARTPSVWTWIGMLLIAVGTISYAYNGYKVQNPSVRVTTLSIHQEFNAILMSLPIEVESSVMLVDAGLRGSVLSDTYQIAKGIGDRTADSLNTEELRTVSAQTSKGITKDPSKRFPILISMMTESSTCLSRARIAATSVAGQVLPRIV